MCGAAPAALVTIRGHQGFFVFMRFLKERGPFCRTCGTAILRRMNARTLWQGWWGIASLVIAPVTLLSNIPERSRIQQLPPPRPAPGRPLDPGRPVLRRPEALGLLVPVAVAALFIVAILAGGTGASSVRAGDCVRRDGQDVVIVDCSSPRAQYTVLTRIDGDSDALCDLWTGTTASYTRTGGGSDFVLCLGPVRPPGSPEPDRDSGRPQDPGDDPGTRDALAPL